MTGAPWDHLSSASETLADDHLATTDVTSGDHVEITAIITDRWGNVERVYAGSQPTWAWEIDRCPEWRKMKRKNLLDDRTSDPRGWRVTFETESDAR